MSRQERTLRAELKLLTLEERLVPSGLSLVSKWDNGSGPYNDGWADNRGDRQIAYLSHFDDEKGMSIVDVTDSADPVLLSRFQPTGADGVTFTDVETTKIGDRWIGLFAAFDFFPNYGAYVVDVTDPAQPTQLAKIGGNAFNLSIDGHLVYVVYPWASNITVFDIKVPENPRFVRGIVSSQVRDVAVRNGRLYTANLAWSQMWDVSRIDEPGAPVQLLGIVNPGYELNSVWPTDDGKFLAVAGYGQGGQLSLWEITDPTHPSQTWETRMPVTETWSAYQVTIRGDFLYAAWFQAGAFIYDISDPNDPVVVGSYDTYPSSLDRDGTTLGARRVFPFLGNDRILVFDMSTGMYTLKLDLSPAPMPVLGENSSGAAVPRVKSSLREMPPSSPIDVAENQSDSASRPVRVTAAQTRQPNARWNGRPRPLDGETGLLAFD